MRLALALLLATPACSSTPMPEASRPPAPAPTPAPAPAPSPVPTPTPTPSTGGFSVHLGTPTQVGDIDPSVIPAYVGRRKEDLLRCYEEQLATNLDLAGTVNASFKITADGSVYSANAYGVDDDLADCVAQILSSIQFPATKGGGIVQVSSYPITFGHDK